MAKMTCNFISYTLRRAVDITVIIPSVTIPESLIDKENCTHKHEPYPVLYLLHGYGNNHATWSGYSNILPNDEMMTITLILFLKNYQNSLKQHSQFQKEKKILTLQDYLWGVLVLYIMDYHIQNVFVQLVHSQAL